MMDGRIQSQIQRSHMNPDISLRWNVPHWLSDPKSYACVTRLSVCRLQLQLLALLLLQVSRKTLLSQREQHYWWYVWTPDHTKGRVYAKRMSAGMWSAAFRSRTAVLLWHLTRIHSGCCCLTAEQMSNAWAFNCSNVQTEAVKVVTEVACLKIQIIYNIRIIWEDNAICAIVPVSSPVGAAANVFESHNAPIPTDARLKLMFNWQFCISLWVSEYNCS